MELNMDKPVWVWLFDFGPHTHPEMWPNGCTVETLPQAHTYAFTSEEEALAHPEKMNWGSKHSYILQKVYLQE